MNAYAKPLTAPFPYFGGKRRIAPVVWQAIGSDVPNFIEPFAGSAAVLLARPGGAQGLEVINDFDGMISNFWRAVKHAPAEVADEADWPVNEIDLHARHYWLLTEGRERLLKIQGDPEAYDSRVAGWWLHGVCSWIGSGYCSGEGPWQVEDGAFVKRSGGTGFRRKVPDISDSGSGIAALGFQRQIPQINHSGRGIAALGFGRQVPQINHSGRGIAALGACPIHEVIARLSDRLRHVRVCSGDWSRVCGSGVSHGKHVGIFLDPPYAATDRADVYTHDDAAVSIQCRDLAISCAKKHGTRARIVFAGYAGEADTDQVFAAAGWRSVAWRANGGFGNQRKAGTNENGARERLWLSPGCLSVDQEGGAA